MIRARVIALSVALLLVPFLSLRAGDLRPWNDDSGMVVTPYPAHFAPAVESANLVVRVFHDVDNAVDMACAVVVTDSEGREVRHIQERQKFLAGEPLQFAPTWNGRDDLGRYLPNGIYTVTATINMHAAGERSRPIQSEDGEGGEAPRVSLIRQHFSGTVVLDSTRRGRPIEVHSQPPNEPGFPFNFYFGTLHNQTSYSDGGHPNDSNCLSSTTHAPGDFDPALAYSYARNTARLDFLGITDHNHLFDNACVGCTAAQVIQRYQTGRTAAASATVDGAFVGIYGMEWGYISSTTYPNQGHIGLFEVPKLFGWEPSSCTAGVDCYYEVYTDPAAAAYGTMYTRALTNPSAWGAFGQFMHPADGTKSAAGQGVDYNSIQYTTDGDDVMHTAAVISGPATDPSTAAVDTGALYAGEPVNGTQYAAYTSSDMFNRILGAGFHVAPVADPDVHCSNYGTSTRDRVVVLATTLTKASIMDAIHRRRVYATSNANTQLVYTLTSGATKYYMGDGGIRTTGAVPTSGAVTIHVSVFDPDAGQAATSIKIKEPVPGNTTGAETVIATGTASPFDYTFTPSAGTHTYYVYVSMNTGDRLWSAPIWINQGATADTTPPTTAITSPVNGATVSGTTPVSASASDNVGVTRVEFYLDNVLQSTDTVAPYDWSWDTTATANGSHTLTSKAYDAANNSAVSAPVSVTVSNIVDYSLSVTPSSATVTAGSTASYTVNVTRTGGFTGSVSFSVSGLPAGATATFNPAATTGASSALSVATSSTTPAGSYALTISGVSGALTHTTSATLVVQAVAADFSLSVSPSSVSVPRAGGTASYTVTITPVNGFTGAVTLSVSGNPAGSTATFNPNPAAPGTSQMTITIPSGSTRGTYPLTVTGVNGALSHTASATLAITK